MEQKFHAKIKELLEKLNLGYMQGVAYDTAWVARLQNMSGKTIFPQSLQWLEDHQKEDGSWGGEVAYYHDRMISTLVSIITLAKSKGKMYSNRIKRGEEYLWENISKLKMDPYETIGFELIFPTAMQEAKKYGLNLPFSDPCVIAYNKIKEKKLSLIPKDMIYSNKTTLTYSMEFFGEEINREKIKNIRFSNGSIGNSPSTTAYSLSLGQNHEGINYIKDCLSLDNNGSVPAMYPFEIFEKAWILNNFIYSGVPIYEEMWPHVNYLKSVWKTPGVAWTNSYPVPDSDGSAVAFKILNTFGYKMDGSFLERYEKENYFITYEFEINPSISANIHILDAIKYCNDYQRKEEVIEKILKYLRNARIDGNHWQDKWHISPYYATAHAIFAIGDLDISLIESTLDWLMRTQNPNGSWGSKDGNIEDTCLAVQCLLFYHNNIGSIDIDIISRGIFWIFNYWDGIIPELWIAKGLYNPENVVISLALSVLYDYYKTFGHNIVMPAIPADFELSEPVK